MVKVDNKLDQFGFKYNLGLWIMTILFTIVWLIVLAIVGTSIIKIINKEGIAIITLIVFCIAMIGSYIGSMIQIWSKK